MKKYLAILLVCVLMLSMVGCGSKNEQAAEKTATSQQTTTEAKTDSKPAEEETKTEAKGLKVALSNSILTNAWRIQMIKIFEAYCKQLQEKGIVSEYYATSSGDDAQAQINAIKNLIAEKYDIILVDCASSALGPVLQEAAEQGIIVVTFDNIVKTDSTYSISVDATAFATNQAKWLCEQLGGKGNIFLIRGKAGAHDDTVRCEAYFKVLEQYPDIKIIGDGYGGWDFGTTAQLMNDLLAANKGTKINGILQQGMGEVAIVEALKQHGYNPSEIPITGEWTNGYFRVVIEEKLNAFITGVPSYLSAMALDIALDVANGKEVERDQVIDPPVIPAENAKDWYQPSQPDEFMPAFTDEKNTWNIKLEDVIDK